MPSYPVMPTACERSCISSQLLRHALRHLIPSPRHSNPMCLKPGPADITSFPPLQVELPVAKSETQIGVPIKYITYLMTDLLAG